MVHAPVPYNPLTKTSLADSIANAVLGGPLREFPIRERFIGAGVYVIYYAGHYEPYAPIAQRNNSETVELPIYVGKAIPQGGRKGGTALDLPHGPNLYNRLNHHAKSIRAADNLNIEDFRCRVLVVEDIFIPLGESLLIRMFLPLWNTVVEGFGNNAPGRRRAQQQKSAWDTLHPGRRWALTLADNQRSEGEILNDVRRYCENGFSPAGQYEIAEDPGVDDDADETEEREQNG